MQVVVHPSITRAGLEQPVRVLADAVARYVRDAAPDSMREEWDLVTDSNGNQLVLVSLQDAITTPVRDVYSPGEISNAFDMDVKERLRGLISRFMGQRLRSQIDEWFERTPVSSAAGD